MNCISTSVFDLFKIGPGPSSSHTIGPMLAAGNFLERLALLPPQEKEQAHHIEVELFGSLALTGKGHGTDRAVAAGLLGETPETCDVERLACLLSDPSESYCSNFDGGKAAFAKSSIRFNTAPHKHPYSNTLAFRLFPADGHPLAEEIYYSIGGGFLSRRGEEPGELNTVPYRYKNWETFCRLTEKYSLTPQAILLENEKTLTGRTEEQIRSRMLRILETMCDAVSRGLRTQGVLPGPIRLERRAAEVYRKACASESESRFLVLLDSFSLAAAEENAAGHRVVTAPTSGSAGLLPGVLYFLHEIRKRPLEELVDGMLMAALIGMIAKHNASISGAEVGCQGEIGVAAAMTAGFLASVNGYPLPVIGSAAEIALEHHLGLSCDPVDGYVQIPCIERNAIGAVTAFNAYMMAAFSDPEKQKVSFDEVLEAMLQTGRCMSPTLKETSLGGLAACTLCG